MVAEKSYPQVRLIYFLKVSLTLLLDRIFLATCTSTYFVSYFVTPRVAW